MEFAFAGPTHSPSGYLHKVLIAFMLSVLQYNIDLEHKYCFNVLILSKNVMHPAVSYNVLRGIMRIWMEWSTWRNVNKGITYGFLWLKCMERYRAKLQSLDLNAKFYPF